MISDAYVLFTCDKCHESEEVMPPVVYSSMAGRDPHIDLRDSALEKCLPRRWEAVDGKHYCEDCAEEMKSKGFSC